LRAEDLKLVTPATFRCVIVRQFPRSLLVPSGRILICDHVNSPSPSGHRAAHFMTVEKHLSTFKEAGFINPREICPATDLSLMGAERS
jgi:hypothetical protein